MLNTSAILKARWPELLLIVGIQCLAQYAIMHLSAQGRQEVPVDTLVLAAFIYTFCFVTIKLLSLGFARTSFTDGPMPWNPWPLMKIGHHFLWRVLGFEITVYTLAIVISMPLALVAKALFYRSAEVTPELMMKLAPLCLAPALLLLARPFLFGPANILVANARIGEAYSFLRYFSVFQKPKLLAAYVMWIIATIFPTALMAFGYEKWATPLALPSVALVTLFSVIIYVSAARAVAQVYLGMQDKESDPPIKEDNL